MVDSIWSNNRRSRLREGYNAIQFRGLSTDTKPANPLDKDTFYETDTGHVYIYWDQEWRLREPDALLEPDKDEVRGLLQNILGELRLIREGGILANTFVELRAEELEVN